jgi:DNA-directed RNA polymerase subunit RPC12/RpoP
MKGQTHTFDSFECAIHALAPKCKHCGTRIVGHGLESGETLYCCGHCAQRDGVNKLRDRA